MNKLKGKLDLVYNKFINIALTLIRELYIVLIKIYQ